MPRRMNSYFLYRLPIIVRDPFGPRGDFLAELQLYFSSTQRVLRVKPVTPLALRCATKVTSVLKNTRDRHVVYYSHLKYGNGSLYSTPYFRLSGSSLRSIRHTPHALLV